MFNITLKHPQMTITNFSYEGSYLPGLTCNMVDRVDTGRSTGRAIPQKLPSSGQEWQFYISVYCLSSYWQMKRHIYTPIQLSIDASNTATLNLADLQADLPPETAI